MEDRIKKFWSNKSDEEIELAFNRSMVVVFVIEVLFTVSIYLLLKTYVSMLAAEFWIFLTYILVVKKNIDSSMQEFKDRLMKRIGRRKPHSETKNEENIEDAKSDSN